MIPSSVSDRGWPLLGEFRFSCGIVSLFLFLERCVDLLFS